MALDQVEQFQLHLSGAPAQAGQLDAWCLPRKMPVRLLDTAHGPAEVAKHLPVSDTSLQFLAPPSGGRGIDVEELVRLADPAKTQGIAAEAPGANARPD